MPLNNMVTKFFYNILSSIKMGKGFAISAIIFETYFSILDKDLRIEKENLDKIGLDNGEINGWADKQIKKMYTLGKKDTHY